MRSATFDRRIHTPSTFSETMHDITDHLGDLRVATRNGHIDRKFANKIMLAVSRINGCRYCLYGYSRAALVAGVDEDVLLCRGMGMGAYESMKSCNIRLVVTDIASITEAVLAYLNGKVINRVERLH